MRDWWKQAKRVDRHHRQIIAEHIDQVPEGSIVNATDDKPIATPANFHLADSNDSAGHM
jgi:hypothetical protein